MATGEECADELNPEEREQCQRLVEAYVGDTDPAATLSVGGDIRKVNLCFQLLKCMVLERKPASATDKSPRSR
jgi:kinesin family protein 6/9